MQHAGHLILFPILMLQILEIPNSVVSKLVVLSNLSFVHIQKNIFFRVQHSLSNPRSHPTRRCKQQANTTNLSVRAQSLLFSSVKVRSTYCSSPSTAPHEPSAWEPCCVREKGRSVALRSRERRKTHGENDNPQQATVVELR